MNTGSGRQYNQKLKAYLIYQYLMQESDENHFVSVANIIAHLEENFGIAAERRSIYKDIEEINKILYALHEEMTIDESEEDIKTNFDGDDSWKVIRYDGSKKGYYVKQRDYDLEDIRAIAECIYSAKFITKEKADLYVDIIANLVSEHQKEDIKHDVLLLDRGKTTNKYLFNNVQKIYFAMKTTSGKNKHTPEKISFKYVTNTLKGETERRKGNRYIVSPYKLIINDGNYYLIAFEDKSAAARTFRVDRMKEIKGTGEPREGEETFRAVDWKAYAKQNFEMYASKDGKKERVTLRFINLLLDTVVDKFGKGLYYQKVDDNHFSVQVEVAVTEQFFGWVCGFGKRVKIISPPHVQEKFVKFLDGIKTKY